VDFFKQKQNLLFHVMYQLLSIPIINFKLIDELLKQNLSLVVGGINLSQL